MSLYHQDEHVTLYHGDAATVLATLPDESVDCIVTSPPYFSLRNYGVNGQIGAEASPAEFVSALVAVFREARRVLTDDGTLWLNLGDSYARNPSKGGSGTPNGRNLAKMGYSGGSLAGLAEKNLIGIPWRVAFALQDDGWILRNDIIWHKSNAMPESVTDRLSSRYEHVFMLSKSPRYWFDLDPIREPLANVSVTRAGRSRSTAYTPSGQRPNKSKETTPHGSGKNPGNVWVIPTKPFAEAHFATMPPALAERCVQAGCKPHGTVLDPFSGSGTTGYAATKHERRYVGIDLNADYLALSLRTRLANTI